jgi:cytoskeletal protein CcmA (bactofilin family)
MFKGDKAKVDIDSPDRLNRLVSGTHLKGDLITESNLRVDGQIDGTVSCKGKFVLGNTGVLNGNLIANEAEVEGTIEGDVKTDGLLTLRKTAIIKGALDVGRIVIEDGAQLLGTISSGDLPKVKSIHHKNTQPTSTNEDIRLPEADVVY